MSGEQPWTICISPEVARVVLRWASGGPADQRRSAAFHHAVDLLRLNGTRASLTKKIKGVEGLWQTRAGDDRIYFDTAPGGRIALGLVEPKLASQRPQRTYQHYARAVREFKDKVEAAGSADCP